MPRRVLVERSDGEPVDLVEVAAPDEHSLQEVMKNRVQLVPADDLGIDGDPRPRRRWA